MMRLAAKFLILVFTLLIFFSLVWFFPPPPHLSFIFLTSLPHTEEVQSAAPLPEADD